ncbi:phosphate/phosphite/phosphonate ABC transporter substrate-binding protein [Pseudaestuariivita rosea]|uniref:phosphate/phosphite/phosphonate ABC transporter substrate-binding protein n=1 Tax=Pseudaestuariivita rosea TaxID=2763263 RepID=UPI001ABBB0F5|nr:PhnD/SsuA/transferrin family substrate-binding protein [Pseudaestuariivita rosea]
MIAALPMYDRPQTQDANDRLWALVHGHLTDLGIPSPPELTRDRPLWDIWIAPDLVLAQTCGGPYREKLHPTVTLVGTPDYALPGCPPGYYNSVVIARQSGDADPFDRPRLAYNDPLSQSGWFAAKSFARHHGITFSATLETGAHANSVTAVLNGQADLAFIDAHTWRMICKWDQTDGLTELARTQPTPGLPLITSPGHDRQALFDAVHQSITDLPDHDRTTLGIAGLIDISADAYLVA